MKKIINVFFVFIILLSLLNCKKNESIVGTWNTDSVASMGVGTGVVAASFTYDFKKDKTFIFKRVQGTSDSTKTLNVSGEYEVKEQLIILRPKKITGSDSDRNVICVLKIVSITDNVLKVIPAGQSEVSLKKVTN